MPRHVMKSERLVMCTRSRERVSHRAAPAHCIFFRAPSPEAAGTARTVLHRALHLSQHHVPIRVGDALDSCADAMAAAAGDGGEDSLLLRTKQTAALYGASGTSLHHYPRACVSVACFSVSRPRWCVNAHHHRGSVELQGHG
jgi:hypothetical protein